MTSALAPVGFLFLSIILCGITSGKIEPRGTNIGAVRFDAVIELYRYFPRSPRHNYTLLFARYWVAPDYYSISVVWAEPQSTDLDFVLHPQSLSITSDQQSFHTAHELYPKYCNRYEKPVGERGVLRQKFGSYAISNIRFAEQEALETRIYAADLGSLNDGAKSGDKLLDVSIPAAKGGNTRDVASLKIQRSGERIDSIRLFDAKRQLLKSISYEYESKGGKTCLRRQTVILPERPMMVGFKSGGMKVTLDGKEYHYRDLEATHHAGGRMCTVEYESVTLGGKEVTLPVPTTSVI